MALSLALLFCGGAGLTAESDLEGFKHTLAPFFENYCLDCHDNATHKGKFSLEGLPPDLLSDDHLETWRLIQDQIFFHEMPPRKKAQPSAAERDAVLAWIRAEFLKTQRPDVARSEKLQLPQFGNYVDHKFLFGERLPRVHPAPPRIWRLRPAIYNAVVPRLGERISNLADGISSLDGPEFKDYASPYFLDEASTAPLLGNAKLVAEHLLAPHSRDRAFKALVDLSAPSETTVHSAIVSAFQKVLGRQPTAEESERFFAFHRKATATAGHQSAAKALLTAILMQPEFFFRSELGDGKPDAFGRVRLTQSEIAYALSYALGNQPLPKFLDAASSGKLSTAEQVAAVVRERLPDSSPNYQKNQRILQFFREYFDYPRANEIFKDQPPGGLHSSERLVADLELTITEILKRDKNILRELLTTREFYVNTSYGGKNATHLLVRRHNVSDKYHTAFSLPYDWKYSVEQQPVRFPNDERAGILTHPAWLAAWSGNFENHPVQRGKWIRTHLLGGTVPDVPIGVDARVPEIEHKSFRERLGVATNAAECWRCHKSMDPLGLAFERYDHYGRYQRLDAGQPVDASAEISRTLDPTLHRTFAGPSEMLDFLGASAFVEQVFIRHVFRYFMGRNETLGDANTLQDAHHTYRTSGGSFNETIVSLLAADSFLLRQTIASTPPEPKPSP